MKRAIPILGTHEDDWLASSIWQKKTNYRVYEKTNNTQRIKGYIYCMAMCYIQYYKLSKIVQL